MFHNEIVKEVRRIREEYSRSFNYDLKAIFANLQRQQADSNREVVNLSRKHGLTTHWGGRARDFGGDARAASHHSIYLILVHLFDSGSFSKGMISGGKN